MSHELQAIPGEVLAAWGYGGASIQPIVAGHINRTYLVLRGGERTVLQWVNPIFGPEIHDDIEVVTAHLEAKGLVTPRLVRTRAGQLHVPDPERGLWRVLTFVAGETVLTAESERRCEAAGALLGAFHAALVDLDYTFQNRRRGIHDTPRHLQRLADVLASQAGHELAALIAPVAEQILHAHAARGPDIGLPERVVHGDPKVSNILFAPDGAGLCLVDLDTLGRMPIAVELGDALRSWCNREAEDAVHAKLDPAYFAAAITGYLPRARELFTRDELVAIPRGVERIALELASRFCTDAFEESYFGWDRQRFERAALHNLQRARAQLGLARSVRQQLATLEQTVQRALDGP